MSNLLRSLAFFILLCPISTLSAQERSLKSILSTLEKDYDVYFSYNPNQIKGIALDISLSSAAAIEETLSNALIPKGLLITATNERFYVIKKESSKFVSFNVRDSETDQPLPYAILRLVGTNLGQVADENGNIQTIIEKPTSSVLSISFLGFEEQLLAVDSLADMQEMVINMQPVPLALDQVEVKEYLNVGIASDPIANSFKIYPHQMEIVPGLSERDVLLSAQMIAGVHSNDESAAGINLRGSSRDNTLLYWNDIPIYHTAHYFGHISSFIPSSIGEMQLYKNYIPVKFGGASAGIIDLKSRNPNNNKISGEASINLTHADFYLNLPFKKDLGSFMFAARRSYNDVIPTWTFKAYEQKLFSSSILDEDEEEIVEGDVSNDLDFTDFNFQWNYQPNSSTQWSASMVRSASSFDYSERDRREKRNFDQTHQIRSLGSNLNFQKRVNDNHSIEAYISFSRYHMNYETLNLRNLNNPNDDDLERRENDLDNLEVRLSSTQKVKDKNWINYGYQLNLIDANSRINARNLLTQDDQDTLSSTGQLHAGFIDYGFSANSNLEIVLSSRLTHMSTLNSVFLSPQVKVNYRINPSMTLKSSYGNYHQFLSTIKEEDFTLSNSVEQIWLLADQDELVPVIENRQISAGLIYEFDNWLVDFDAYQKNISGLLARNLGFATRNEDGYAQGKEQITGLDLTIRKRWRYVRLWTTYSFQDSNVHFDKLFPSSFPSSLNRRHQARVTAAYSLAQWEFSLGYQYKSGLPFTDVNDIIIRDQDGNRKPPRNVIDQDDEFVFLDYESPNSSRLPNYHRFDASAWYRWKSAKLKGEVGLSLINLFDRKNIFDVDYYIEKEEGEKPGEPDELEIYKRTKYFLRFTPNLTFRIIF